MREFPQISLQNLAEPCLNSLMSGAFIPTPPRKKKPPPRPLSLLIPELVAPALAKRGFASLEIIEHWTEIVGANLAEHTRPLAVKWPPRRSVSELDAPVESATLQIAVTGAFALEVQMQSAQVIARINRRLGWACIGKLTLKQMPIEAPVRARKHTPPSAAIMASVAPDVQEISDPRLRAALQRLGAEIKQEALREKMDKERGR